MPHKDPEQGREWHRLHYLAHRGLYNKRSAEWYQHNKEYWKAKMKEARRLLKLAAFEAYGGAFCSCCGEKELIFLSIDHINGRKDVGHKGMLSKDLYLWLANHDYPDGFRVLCFNCNHGRFLNAGICPHEEKRK